MVLAKFAPTCQSSIFYWVKFKGDRVMEIYFRPLYSFVASVVLVVGASSAWAAPVPAEFNFAFDGSSLPSAQDFTLSSSLNAESSDGDIYTMDIGGVGNAGVYSADNFVWVNAPSTLEYRLKILDAQNFRINFSVAGRGTYQMALFADFFAPNDDWLFSGSGGAELALSPDEFHTIRLVDNSATLGVYSTAYDVYVDGDLALSQWEGSGAAVFTPLLFGDIGGAGSGSVEIDYLAWTFDGAFVPSVPEPATMMLMLVGATLLVSSKRRH